MLYAGDLEGEVETAPIDADNLGGRPASEYATQNYVKNEIANAQLGGDSGDVDLSGLATKDELSNAIKNIDYPVDSVNGKIGNVTLSASDVGALPITGGTLTGELKVNRDTTNGIRMWTDGEGGNLRIYPPTSTDTDYWDIDCHDGGMRIFAYKKSTNPNGGPGNVFPLKLSTDGAISVGNNAKTRENLGVAPSGYGWGETQTSYNPPNGDPDKVDRTCVFSCSQGGIPRGGVWRGVAHFQNANNGQMVLRSYTNGDGVVARRYKIDGEWKPWEYENPWMTPGTEYRTTELWNGKPVYTKTINYGKLAASGTQLSIPLGCTATNLIDFNILTTLSSGTQYNFPAFSFSSAGAMLTGYFNETKTAFVVKCHTDLSTATAVATVKYTKD